MKITTRNLIENEAIVRFCCSLSRWAGLCIKNDRGKDTEYQLCRRGLVQEKRLEIWTQMARGTRAIYEGIPPRDSVVIIYLFMYSRTLLI